MSTERADQPGIGRDPEQTGPVTSDVISGASQGHADTGTGPVPAARQWGPPAPDPASVTAPHAVPGQARGGRPVPPPRRSATPPPRGSGTPPPQQGRKASRDQHVVAFVLHQFPIGHMPVAATSPSRQLPLSADDAPWAHPNAGTVDAAGWAARVRAGAARTCPRAQGEAVPGVLTDGYRQHGDLGELEWERAFRVQAGTVWPDAESAEPVVLTPDTVVDHLGDGFGRILAPVGTPFAQRSLPPEALSLPYRRFRLLRPVPVWHTETAPWFAQPGGGSRYRTTCPVVELIALGHLLELTEEVETLRLSKADAPREDER